MNTEVVNRYARTIAVAVGGGVVADWAGAPLPYVFGSLFASAVVGLAGVRLALPPRQLSAGNRVIIGVVVGSAIEPELFSRLPELGASVALVPVQVLLVVIMCRWYLRRVSQLTSADRILASLPGGLFTIVGALETTGGDVRHVGLLHTVRIAAVVSILPFALTWGASSTPGGSALLTPLVEMEWVEIGWFLALAIGGWIAAQVIRIPGSEVMLPLVLAATVRLSGWGAHPPPLELVLIAQMLLGSSIGARFQGDSFRELRGWLAIGAGLAGISLAVSMVLAVMLFYATGLPLATGVLAFAPGGVTEMSLVALALGIDAGFVASVHMWRLVLIVSLIPILLRRIQREP